MMLYVCDVNELLSKGFSIGCAYQSVSEGHNAPKIEVVNSWLDWNMAGSRFDHPPTCPRLRSINAI